MGPNSIQRIGDDAKRSECSSQHGGTLPSAQSTLAVERAEDGTILRPSASKKHDLTL
jgi:hypothetical protein